MVKREPNKMEALIFDLTRSLVKVTRLMFPKADDDELRRMIEAAVDEVIEENGVC